VVTGSLAKTNAQENSQRHPPQCYALADFPPLKVVTEKEVEGTLSRRRSAALERWRMRRSRPDGLAAVRRFDPRGA
jgi:hypothetical protein